MSEEIKRGDKVDVYWEQVECLFGCTVDYIPVATGDSWRLIDVRGNLHYVQNFCRMTRKHP